MKTRKCIAVLALALALSPGIALAGPALSHTITLVAAKGDQIGAPGKDIKLSAAGPAAIDAAGNIAVRMIISGTSVKSGANAGIVLIKDGGLQLFAKLGAPDPITGGTFSKISDPVLSGSGAFAFLGSRKVGGSGIYVYNPATESVSLVVNVGQTFMTGTTLGTYTGFSQFALNDAGGIAYLATGKGQGWSSSGFFATDQSGVQRLIVGKGPAGENTAPSFSAFPSLPFVAGQTRTLDTVGGNVSMVGKFGDEGQTAIGLAFSGSNEFTSDHVAQVGGDIPGLPGVFVKSLGAPIVNANGSIAFGISVSGTSINASNNAGIGLMTGDGNVEGFVARLGEYAPDNAGSPTSMVFKKFSAPVLNDNDRIAFLGTVKTGGTSGATGSSDTGIWSDWSGTMQCVVREGDLAPGGNGGKFSSFKQIVLPKRFGPIFLATLSGVPAKQNTGVWAVGPGGDLHRVVKTGDTLDFRGKSKAVKSISVFALASSSIGQSRSFDPSSGNIVFRATFADGSWGIYRSVWNSDL